MGGGGEKVGGGAGRREGRVNFGPDVKTNKK